MATAEIKPTIPLLLSFNAGYVDTAGFLALQGLFTAHVTGNFVTLGASAVLGTSGAIAKLLALPVFCIAIVMTRLLSSTLLRRGLPAFKLIITLKVLFLIAGAVFAIRLGPFPQGDSISAIVTGMTLVVAMAVQNAAHRIHLTSLPPSTLMTGTTTQIMIDIADIINKPEREPNEKLGSRLLQMSINVAVFATGCAIAALFYSRFGVLCFALPPIIGLMALIIVNFDRSASE